MNQQINTIIAALSLAQNQMGSERPPAEDEDRLLWDTYEHAITQARELEAAMREPAGWIDDGGLVFWKEGRLPADGSDLFAAPPAQQAQPTESVLVDGIAYDTPAPVAAELLRLHLEGKQAQAEAVPQLSRDDQRMLLWRAIGWAASVGNATDDKLILEALHRDRLCIAAAPQQKGGGHVG